MKGSHPNEEAGRTFQEKALCLSLTAASLPADLWIWIEAGTGGCGPDEARPGVSDQWLPEWLTQL